MINLDVMIMNDSSIERLRLRNKIVSEGRTKLDKSIKTGAYIELVKKERDVMDMNSILLDKEFFDDMKKEIERNRERRIVYDKDYKESDLNDWRKKNKRRLILREISKKSKNIKLKIDVKKEKIEVN